MQYTFEMRSGKTTVVTGTSISEVTEDGIKRYRVLDGTDLKAELAKDAVASVVVSE